jgi:hypothetical protein
MHAYHSVFISALEGMRQVTFTFLNAKEGKEQTLLCAPLDFGPLRGALDKSPRYQLWDLKAKRPPFNVTALVEDVRSIVALDASFEPEAIIKWAFKPNAWSHARDWGAFS